MTLADKDLQYDEIKAVNNATINVDTAEGIVEAFAAAIGNKDSVGDIIVPGAFAKSLQHRKPRVVWGHDWNSPIGKVIDIEEIPPTDRRIPARMKAMGVGGLYVKVQFNLGSARGKEAFNDVLFYGNEQEWSIGYKTIRKSYDPERSANILHEVELYEVSPVLHGANNLTSTISIKDDDVSTEIKNNNFSTSIDNWNTSTSWTGTTMTPASWDFQMNEKTYGEMMPVRQEPEPTAEMKLRKAFMAAFGPLNDLKLMDGNQAVFSRDDATWAVKYRVDGPRLMVTKPQKVNVRTVIEPIQVEESSYHGDDETSATPPVQYSEEPVRRKREVSPGERESLAKEGNAMADGSYPIASVSDLKNAIQAFGRAKNKDAVKAHIKKRARALGATDSLPDSWMTSDKSLEDDVEDKAGRVISQGNMAKLGKAADMIKEVITAGTRATVTDERPPMMKKDGESLADAYKTADVYSDIVVVKSDTLTGKIVHLTSKEESPSMEKVQALVDGLVPLAEEHGWTLMAPSQKSLDDGTCSLGIHFSSDKYMKNQVEALSQALKAADCDVNIEIEKQEFYGNGTKSFDEVFLVE